MRACFTIRGRGEIAMMSQLGYGYARKLYKETLTLIRPVDHCVFRNFNCVAHLHNRGTALLNQDQRTISPRLPLPSIAITSEASSIRHISCSSPDPTRLHIHLLATFCSFCFCLLRRICPGYSLPPARSGQLRKRKHEGLPKATEPQSATLAMARAVQHANDPAATSAVCARAQARYMRSIETGLVS